MKSMNLPEDENLSNLSNEVINGDLGEKEKNHFCLIISKSTLQSYLERGGHRIELQFREEKDRMDLSFIGYDKENKPFEQEMLQVFTEGCKPRKLKTIGYGVFYHDFNETPLHNILIPADRVTLIDWYLQPVGYEYECKFYVGYDISSDAQFSMIAASANPCPPCNTTRPK